MEVMNRFSKLTKATSSIKTTANTVTAIFTSDWVSKFCIPVNVPTDNGPHFTSPFFPEICVGLGARPLTTTEYNPQADGKVKLFSSRNVSILYHFVAEHQEDCNSYVVPLTYA